MKKTILIAAVLLLATSGLATGADRPSDRTRDTCSGAIGTFLGLLDLCEPLVQPPGRQLLGPPTPARNDDAHRRDRIRDEPRTMPPTPGPSPKPQPLPLNSSD